MMKESEVKREIKKFLDDQGYFVCDEFNVKKGVRVDVVAIRWKDESTLEANAIACKRQKTPPPLMDTASERGRKLQKYFPLVYLASPEPRPNHLNRIKKALGALRIGFISVGKKGVSIEQEAKTSPKLKRKGFSYRVRQRAAAILAYVDVFGRNQNLEIRVRNPEEVWCFIDEPVNYTLGHREEDPACYFGVDVEKKKNVEKVMSEEDPRSLYRDLKNLSDGYRVRLEYIDIYRPRPVQWSLLEKKVKDLTQNNVERILSTAEKKDWKVRFKVEKRIWDRDEILFRRDYSDRLRDAKKELDPLLGRLKKHLFKT